MPGLNWQTVGGGEHRHCAETVVPLGRLVGSQLDSTKDDKGQKKQNKKR